MPDLGIEAASDDASLALLEGDRVLAVRRWHIGSTASRELLAALADLLTEAGVARDALRSIAVDTGPGGYGSLRTSVATAQGMAVALGIPLAGVDRLEVAACQHLAPGVPVVAVHDLGRAGIAWAAFAPCEAPESRGPERMGPTRIDSIEECVRLAPSGAVWCGDLTPDVLAAITRVDGTPASTTAHEAGSEVTGTDTASSSDDTGALGVGPLDAVDVVRLARLRHAYGDPASVDVTYLRPPSIGARRALG